MDNATEIKSIFWIGTALMLCFAFGLLCIAVFYQNHFSKMKRREAELLLKVSLESEKAERQRIAADLHDGVSGDLSAVRNYLVILHKNEQDPEKQEMFADIKSGIDAALENTRLVSYKLMPPLLETSGFAVALQDYFERLMKGRTASFIVNHPDDTFCFTQTTAYEVFRIIQEFTTNMIKYGAITSCKVNLSASGKYCMVEIIDDGMSFNFGDQLKVSTGTGIKNINSRLKVLDAKLLQKEVPSGNHFIITLKKDVC